MSLDLLPPDAGPVLTGTARAAIASRLGQPAVPPADAGWLLQPGATFVTLTQEGELRGCIGSLQARRPLGEDVVDNARAAAFRDPRFPPLEAFELAATSIEVSVLTEPRPLPVRDEADARRVLRPHVDGVIFSAGPYRSTFLPQVWEDLPDPAQFLAQLKRKAGLSASSWPPGTTIQIYQVTKFQETP